MASSGTINGNRSGYKPYLRIKWNIDQTDIPGNRTRLRLRLYLMHPYAVYYSATKSGKLQGRSFSSTKNVSGTGSTHLKTEYVWVGHNSDGTKTQNLNASFNIAITFSGRSLSSLSVSGNASLNRIPRKTDLTSASISSLQAGKSATLSLSRDVKYSGFYHLVSIYDGSAWIWDANYEHGSPSTSYTLSSSKVDKMLGRMKNVTKKTFRVRIRTYTKSGGSGHIGSSTRNVTVSVHSSVKPSASGIGVDVQGSGKDDDIGKFVQGISRVYASFSSSVTGGAGVSSRSITVRKVGGADSQTISGWSGSTSREVRSSGTYEAIGTIRDTRGRTDTSSMTFTVHSYDAPNITNFTATRKESTPTTVSIRREGTHTSLGGDNTATMLIERKSGTGDWTTVQDTFDSGGTWGNTATSTGNSVTSSYDFRATLTDIFGNTATATTTVSTQRVVLDVHKNEGVGIGKIHEQGVLDVDGGAYFAGPVHLDEIVSNNAGHDTDVNTLTKTGFYHVGSTAENAPVRSWGFLYVNAGETAGGFNVSQIYHPRGYVSGFSGRGAPMYVRVMSDNKWGDWRLVGAPERGSNSNGHWVRFEDGTQICRFDTALKGRVDYGSGKLSDLYRTGMETWNFPKDFVLTPSVSVVPNMPGANSGSRRATTTTLNGVSSSSVKLQVYLLMTTNKNLTIYLNMTAIGKWK